MSIDPKQAPEDEPGDVLRRRQGERTARYREHAAEAWTTDQASTVAEVPDPLHTSVDLGHGVRLDLVVHERIGGFSDLPVPGDVLCAALAACADSTVRIIASRLGVKLERLIVRAEADVDVRGTLCVEPGVPVGFQAMRVHIQLLAPEADPRALSKLLLAAEHCCVVLRTLRSGVPVTVSCEHGHARAGGDL
jgi:uncharacterized OsmC-like protein